MIKKIREKTDLRMERLDPSSSEYENGFAIDGNYTVRKQDIIQDQAGWTRSFFTGMVAYMYFETKEKKYLDYLEKSLPVYEEFMQASIKINNMPHDAGFLYSLYSGAYYEVSGDKRAYDMNYRVADEFAKRFRYNAGILQGFGYAREKEPQTIIDDLMNLSLLLWAYRMTGHPYYEEIVKTHINTVIRVMFREDYTVRHAYVFDEFTGEPKGERNFCGYAPGSVWARGQAWAVYGLVSAIKCFGNVEQWVFALNGLLNRYIEFLPEDGIPMWDLRRIGSHGENTFVDTSAAAVLAAAIYKLDDFFDMSTFQGEAKNAVKYADLIYESLIQKYMYKDDVEAIIDKGQCGILNTGCVWGDYFFAEIVMRRKYGKDTPDFFC